MLTITRVRLDVVRPGGTTTREVPSAPSWPGLRRGTTMATFVLVHGAGHGGWCYQRVSRLLRSAGHQVHTPTMTGVGERSHLVGPHVDLNLHIQDIAAVLHYEDLRDVILAGHS
jgi:pimeloyl-ACP methyl ester carboxylesterase